jgi:N-methylhydantoinase A/acetophenone carboxylase
VLQGVEDVHQLCELFTRRYSEMYSPEAAFPVGGINVECFYLSASVHQELAEFHKETLSGTDAQHALFGARHACFDPAAGLVETPVYDWPALRAGNVIQGPALIEAPETTYVIEPGWTYTMDQWRNGILEQMPCTTP